LTTGKIFAGLGSFAGSPAKIFPALASPLCALYSSGGCCRGVFHPEVVMTSPVLPAGLRLESLEVGAAPLIDHFLDRLGLSRLFGQHLPKLPGREPALSSPTVLCLLVSNLLLARQPLYALPGWAARREGEPLGLLPGQTKLLNDDRLGRALDHLRRADRASLLTALVRQAVRVFQIDLAEFHQDTTSVTVSGEYAGQPPVDEPGRPPRITFGYNKDHRPDLKQLLFSIAISADGAVPIHAKIYDGNTTDDAVHQEIWDFLKELVGHAGFLYVADSKLCTRDNMSHIADGQGRFLTIMPRTRAEDGWFREYLQSHPLEWEEVHREPNPRRRDGPDVVYHAVASPRPSSEGYRVLWYRSSQKVQQDQQQRQQRLERAYARLDALQSPGRRPCRSYSQAEQAAQRILQEERVEGLLCVEIDQEVQETYRQVSPGRPGPNTEYRREETWEYRIRFKPDTEAQRRQARCDGLFPLMTNDETLSLAGALKKYKYQPFVEKRHEQLKSVFCVTPVWLKNAGRVESLLWLYYVVELVQALLEREVRREMKKQGVQSLALYPEGRASEAPTAQVVINALEGLRRHRLLDAQGQELQRFHDELPDAAREVLELLGVDCSPWSIS
jgi:transposase